MRKAPLKWTFRRMGKQFLMVDLKREITKGNETWVGPEVFYDP